MPSSNGNIVLLFAANAENITIEGSGTSQASGLGLVISRTRSFRHFGVIGGAGVVFCWVLLVESGVSSSLASVCGVSLSSKEMMWHGNRTGGEILAAGVRHDCGCWLLLVGV